MAQPVGVRPALVGHVPAQARWICLASQWASSSASVAGMTNSLSAPAAPGLYSSP